MSRTLQPAPSPTLLKVPTPALTALRVPKKAKIKPTDRLEARGVHFSSNGKLLLVGYRSDLLGTTNKISGVARIYKVSTGKLVKSWRVSDPVIGGVFLPSGKVALTSANQVQFWDWRKGKLLKKLASSNPQGTLAVSTKGNLVSSGIDVYRLKPFAKQTTLKPGNEVFEAFVVNASISPNESRLVLGAWDVREGIEAYDTRSGHKLWTAKGDSTGDIAWSPTGQIIAVSTTDGIRVLKAANGALLRTIQREDSRNLWFLRDGKELASIGDGAELIIYKMPSAKIIRRSRLEKEMIYSLSPDGNTVAEVSQYGLNVRFKRL